MHPQLGKFVVPDNPISTSRMDQLLQREREKNKNKKKGKKKKLEENED